MSAIPQAPVLRAAQVQDLPLLAQWLRQLAAEEGVLAPRSDEAFLQRSLFAAQPAAHAYLIEGPDGPVGLSVFSWKWGAFSGSLDMYLHAHYLLPAARGQGLGAAALRELMALARAAGASRLELLTTVGNATATAFYERMGVLPAAHMQVRRWSCAIPA